MQKLIKIGKKVSVYLDSGDFIEGELTETQFKTLVGLKDDEEIRELLNPKYKSAKLQARKAVNLIERIKVSKLLTIDSALSVYWPEVSVLSLPQDLAETIVEAEETKDELKIVTYRNFWTLMSLNTDEQCRINLYRFLKEHGMKLAKCGFFVAYRNVCSTKEKGIYTDQYSHSTTIKIGDMVILDRSKCDADSSIECGKGLHVASSKWLEKNYFGNTGLACLVNPADVVAVPINCSTYGKLRTCAYLPIKKIDYNADCKVIPLDVENGFDCSYVTKVIYEGIMGTEEDSPYKIVIPDTADKPKITDNILEIAKDCIINRIL